MADHVLEHRAKYHPVTPIEATIANTATGRRRRIVANMCAVHAKLWDGLTEPQKDAGNHVGRCHRVTHGSPEKAVDLTRLIEPTGGEMSAEREQAFRADLFAWQSACLLDGVDYYPATLVFGWGKSVSDMASSGHRRGLITEQIHLALDVMAKLKGWK